MMMSMINDAGMPARSDADADALVLPAGRRVEGIGFLILNYMYVVPRRDSTYPTCTYIYLTPTPTECVP